MGSKFQFRLTEKANAELDDTISYIAVELANPKAASDFMDKLGAAIDEACLLPESGSPVVNDLLGGWEVRKKIIGNYIMYYWPDLTEKIIYVLRIVYEGRNMDDILRQMDI